MGGGFRYLVDATAMDDQPGGLTLVADEMNAAPPAFAHDLGRALARDDAVACRQALVASLAG